MSDQRIIIEFIGDPSGLKPGIDALQRVTTLTKEQQAAFEQTNEEFQRGQKLYIEQIAHAERLKHASKSAAAGVAEINAKNREATQSAKALADGFKEVPKTLSDAANKLNGVSASLGGFVKGSDGARRLNAEMMRNSKTLADLELKLSRLRELLRDDTEIGTKGFKAVTAEIKKTEDAIAKANGKLDDTGKKSNAVVDGFKKMALAFGFAFGIQQAISLGREMVNVAAKTEGVERAFKRIGSPELLEGLRQATRGTVSDLVLMQNSVKAANFEIPLEQMASLLKFAQVRARETGESVDYLVDSIILGIGRKSPLILDNLGISAIKLREKFGGLSAEAATVGDVAKAVGEITNEELAKIGVQADTTADRQARLSVAFEHVKERGGEALIAIGTGWAYMLGLIDKQDDRLAIAASNAMRFEAQIRAAMTEGAMNRDQLLRREISIRQELADIQKERQKIEARLNEIAGQRKSITNVRETIQETNALKERLKTIEATVIYQTASLDVLRRLRNEAKEDFSFIKTNDIKNVAYYNDAIAEVTKAINDHGTAVDKISGLVAKRNQLQKELDALLGKQAKQEQDANRGAAGSITRLNYELGILKKSMEDATAGSMEFWAASAKVTAKTKELETALKLLQKTVTEFSASDAVVEIELEGMTTTDFDFAREQMQRRADMERLFILESVKDKGERDAMLERMEVSHLKNMIGLYKRFGLDTTELQIQLAEKRVEVNDKMFADMFGSAEEWAEKSGNKVQQFFQDFQTELQGAAAAFSSVFEGMTRLQQTALNQQQAQLDRQLKQGLISQETYDRQRGILMRRQAELEKQAALFKAIINVAAAVATALTAGPVAGQILAGVTAALGAVEIGIIASTPIPQFAKGTRKAPAGFKWVGEEGPELLYDRGGGAIITNKESNIIDSNPWGMAAQHIMSKYGIPTMSVSDRIIQVSSKAVSSSAQERGEAFDYERLADILADRIMFPDANIVAATDRMRRSTKSGFEYLAAVMREAQGPKRGGYV